MTDTTIKIRPGIRAKFDDGREGIIGVPYDRHSFESWFEGEWGFAETDRLTPLPFKPGDRVKDSKTGRMATVVFGGSAALGEMTAIHFDLNAAIDIVHMDRLTLLDYPGKEAK